MTVAVGNDRVGSITFCSLELQNRVDIPLNYASTKQSFFLKKYFGPVDSARSRFGRQNSASAKGGAGRGQKPVFEVVEH